MSEPSRITIVNVGYCSTNFWVVSAGTSRLLVDGSVFTGDLTHPALLGEGDASTAGASWRLLREHGARRVYPGHRPVRNLRLDLEG